MHREPSVVDVEILDEKIVGREGGFLAIRRLSMVNVRDDGSRSRPYLCDFLTRDKGTDAVVVAVYRYDADGRVLVLLRDGLRPPLKLGRSDHPSLFCREVVAGIVERADIGEEGIRRRAVIEVEEEAGLAVDAAKVVFLGAGTFPSPGAMPEKFWLTAVEVADAKAAPLLGDGSPMEEGARTEWMELDAAIDACVAGEIEDAKTELTLRRLREML